jgi:hypothetical protein
MGTSGYAPWQLYVDTRRQLLCQRWLKRYHTHSFRPAMQLTVQLLQKLDVRRWLFDLNNLPNVSLDDQSWVSQWLLPELTKLHLSKVAIVFSSNLYNQLATEALLGASPQYVTCDTQFFADSESAADWLNNGRTQLANLVELTSLLPVRQLQD